MKTHKQKAIELLKKMHLFTSGDSGKDDLTWANAKQCALIEVHDILDMLAFDLGHDETARGLYKYYEEVKKEIES